MKIIKYTLLLMVATLFFAACTPTLPDSPVSSKKSPRIYPDYKDVTIPCNIAPLTFEVIEDGATSILTSFSAGDKQLLLSGKNVTPSLEEWRDLLSAFSAPGKMKVDTYFEKDGKWYMNRAFHINVSTDTIDRYLSYRLIPPSYVAYEKLDIMQRDLTSYDEKVIYSNMFVTSVSNSQCINCHHYKNYKTDNMQFHARQHLGGTFFVHNGEARKIDLKTDSTISAGVYPAFNPVYDVVAYSVNNTGQAFHTVDYNKVEVQDAASDLILYNPVKNTVSFISNESNLLEVFPCWSADGRTLYYCCARFEVKDGVNEITKEEVLRYKEIKYDILSRRWDPDTYEFSDPDTLFACSQMGKSATLPRVSPDGRYMLFALGEYGCFHVWHRDADIYMLDLANGQVRALKKSNSSDAESYPTWSSSGKWIMFSSRRDDGNYTRVYIAHVEPDGSTSKAFLLPQGNPSFHTLFDKSFNRPEFMVEPVSFTPLEALEVLNGESLKATYSKNCK
ncbi:MAG: PD40 domain-containing protein [Bacteroidaceae bacterium]|nr:PD40 domain-containing protein [Bacteroidaceae bacterium]